MARSDLNEVPTLIENEHCTIDDRFLLSHEKMVLHQLIQANKSEFVCHKYKRKCVGVANAVSLGFIRKTFRINKRKKESIVLHILSCRQIFIKNESAADCIARYIDMTTFDTKVFKFACSFWVIFFFVYTNAFCKQTSSKNTQTMKYIPRVNDFCFNYYNGYISKIRIGFWCERI